MRRLPSLLLVAGLAATGGHAAEVASSPDSVRPLLIGATVPEVTVSRVDGTPVDLSAAAGEGPAVWIFYRGGW